MNMTRINNIEELVNICYQRNALIYGRQGAGKTTMARALALELAQKKIAQHQIGSALVTQGVSKQKIVENLLGAASFLDALGVWTPEVQKEVDAELAYIYKSRKIAPKDIEEGKDPLTNYVKTFHDPDIVSHKSDFDSPMSKSLRLLSAIRLGWADELNISLKSFSESALAGLQIDILAESTENKSPVNIVLDPFSDGGFELRDSRMGIEKSIYFFGDIVPVIAVISYFGVCRFSAWHDGFLRPMARKSAEGAKKGGISPVSIARLSSTNIKVEEMRGTSLIEHRNDTDNEVILALTAVTYNMDTGELRIRDHSDKAASEFFFVDPSVLEEAKRIFANGDKND